jgi:hypothetical protein
MTTIEDDDYDEAGTAEFVDTLLEQFIPRQASRITLLDLGGGSIDELIDRQREQFEELDLLSRGLPPHHQARLIERLAPKWAELVALMNENRRAALRMLAKRRVA